MSPKLWLEMPDVCFPVQMLRANNGGRTVFMKELAMEWRAKGRTEATAIKMNDFPNKQRRLIAMKIHYMAKDLSSKKP